MKNILVLTDFSHVSEMAVDYAMVIAKTFKSEIHFLHTIGTTDQPSERTYPVEIINSIENRLIDHENRASDFGLQARHFTPIDQPYFDIVDHVKKYDHDLVIIGSYGLEGITETFSHSNTQEIVRHCPCSVLVIKKQPAKIIFNNITYASRFYPEDSGPFQEVLSMVSVLNAHLTLLYVSTPHHRERQDLVKERIQKFITPYSLQTDQCFAEYDKCSEDGILNFLDHHKMDLLAIAACERIGPERFIHPDFTETLVNHMKVPVLTIKKIKNG